MSEPSQTAVRFACPRCLARLMAPCGQVGTNRRCPNCQHVCVVPSAAEAARRGRDPGQYGVAEGMESAATDSRVYLTVVCSLCRSLMRITEDQVGRPLTCPDCGRTSLATPTVKGESKRPQPVTTESYALLEEDEEGGAETPPARFVSMTCPRCRTLVRMPESETGKTTACPDCSLTMTVPPYVEPPKKKGVDAEHLGEYVVHDDAADAPPGETPDAPDRYRVFCPLCQALIYVERSRAGRKVVCGDCGAPFDAPRPPEPKRRRDLAAEAGELYGVSDAAETSAPLPEGAAARGRFTLGGLSPSHRGKPADPPPRWTFLSGVFGFPAYGNCWPKWLGLSCGLFFPMFFARYAWVLSQSPAGARELSIIPWVGALILTTVAVLSVVIWAFVAFASMLSILRDTAYGHRQVEDWPDDVFLDWFGEIWFLLVAIGLSVAPGIGIGAAMQLHGMEMMFAAGASLLVFFPIHLLAMLETNSPMNPFSLPVWRSLAVWWWVWGAFYLVSALVAVGGGLLVALVFMGIPRAGVFVAPGLVVATLMVYFRLLGRLAWRCGRR